MLKRFSISLEEELLAQFDAFIRSRGYVNRSEAVRDLIRRDFVNDEWEEDGEVVGVVTLVYDHHQPQLQKRLADIQHDQFHLITSTTHVHMDHHNCLEVVIVKGRAAQIQNMAAQMIALRGVKNGKLTTASTGQALP